MQPRHEGMPLRTADCLPWQHHRACMHSMGTQSPGACMHVEALIAGAHHPPAPATARTRMQAQLTRHATAERTRLLDHFYQMSCQGHSACTKGPRPVAGPPCGLDTPSPHGLRISAQERPRSRAHSLIRTHYYVHSNLPICRMPARPQLRLRSRARPCEGIIMAPPDDRMDDAWRGMHGQ